jgi:ATP/maltotriose-dependent transcriptional regulator MalT
MNKKAKGDAPSGVKSVSLGALDALIAKGDTAVIFELLISNARQLALTGKGQQLMKMAPYMGDESPSGLAIRRGFVMLGHVIDLDFDVAEALANHLIEEEKNNPVYDFLQKITNYVFANARFARGDLEGAKSAIKAALDAPVISSDLGDTDKIQLIRMRCAILMIQFAEPEIEEQLNLAQMIADNSNENVYGIHLMAIKAMVLSQKGEYLKALELAKSALHSSEANGYTGVNSPLDAKQVIAQCYFAFSKLEQANEMLEEIKADALKFGLNPWYVMAEGSIIRNLAALARTQEALEKSNTLREYVKKFPVAYDLGWMVDISEMFVRYRLKDLNRVQELVKRIPDLYFVKQVVLAMTYTDGRLPPIESIFKLSERTPKEKIYKYLYLSEYPATSTNNPKKYMREALRIGQETGSREIFVKQFDTHLNLILSLASEEPSMYLEELSRDCLNRHELETSTRELKNESLTSREQQVLKHLATGKAINIIGKELHISQNTMKTHLRNIYRKLQVDGRKSAVEKAKANFII